MECVITTQTISELLPLLLATAFAGGLIYNFLADVLRGFFWVTRRLLKLKKKKKEKQKRDNNNIEKGLVEVEKDLQISHTVK